MVRDIFGCNPLICAVKAKAMPCVEAIKNAGGAIDAATYKIGVDLCLAAARGDIDQLKCFLAAGADMNERDYSGKTALHLVSSAVIKISVVEAVAYDHKKCVEFLINCGLDPEVMNDCGITPSSEACKKERQSDTFCTNLYFIFSPWQ